ncbi:hypothetical protein PtB15_1B585 [Puccinia triticina]|nr:hypothetical protein PtB15_1B585 [Puccinia triticina]
MSSLVSRVCTYLSQVTSGIPYIAFTVSFGLMVDMASFGLLVPVLPYRLEAIGYAEVAASTSYLIAAFAFGLIVSSIPISILGEMVKSRKLPLLAGLTCLAASLAAFWLSSSFAVLVISRIIQGFSGTAIWTLGLALICDVVPEARIGVVMGYVLIGWSIGTVAGPLIGGLLYDSYGYDAIFIFALSMTAVDFVLRSLVQDKKCIQNIAAPAPLDAELDAEKRAECAGDARPKPASAARAVLSLLTNPRVLTLFALTLVIGFAFGGLLDTGLAMLVKHRYGLSSHGAALMFIAVVVPSVVSSPIAGHLADKIGAKTPVVSLLLLGTPFFGLMSINASLPALVTFIAFAGIFMLALAAPLMQDLAEVVKVTPGLGFAHVYGIFNMVYSTGAMIGSLCVGGLLQGLGIESGWQVMCLLITGLFAASVVPAWLFIGGPRATRAEEAASPV